MSVLVKNSLIVTDTSERYLLKFCFCFTFYRNIIATLLACYFQNSDRLRVSKGKLFVKHFFLLLSRLTVVRGQQNNNYSFKTILTESRQSASVGSKLEITKYPRALNKLTKFIIIIITHNIHDTHQVNT